LGQVVSEVEEMEADQEFFSDITSVSVVGIKSLLMRWPKHEQLIATLKHSQMRTINYATLRFLFPRWKPSSMVSFLNYYSNYDFMHVTHRNEPSEEDETIRKIVTQVEERISVMIGCAIPTAGQRLMSRKRLDMLAAKECENQMRFQMQKKKDGNGLFPVGPTLPDEVEIKSQIHGLQSQVNDLTTHVTRILEILQR
jgi:hypothetical protein